MYKNCDTLMSYGVEFLHSVIEPRKIPSYIFLEGHFLSDIEIAIKLNRFCFAIVKRNNLSSSFEESDALSGNFS